MNSVISIHACPYEPPRDKTNKMACAPSEDSDQPGHPPSLIRVFAVRMKKALVLSYPLSAQRRLWSDWADAQADLSLRWAHSHFVGFVTRRLICVRVLACVCLRACVRAWLACVCLLAFVLAVIARRRTSLCHLFNVFLCFQKTANQGINC